MAISIPLALLLSQEEIQRLTPAQLDALREEIQKEFRTSGAVQDILKARARQVYSQLAGGSST